MKLFYVVSAFLIMCVLALAATAQNPYPQLPTIADPSHPDYPIVGHGPVNGIVVPCYSMPDRIVCTANEPRRAAEASAAARQLEAARALARANRKPLELGAAAVCLLFLAIYARAGWWRVDPWNRVVLKRFGKYVGTLEGGWHWREPFVHSAVDVVEMRVQVDDVYEEMGYKTLPSMQTRDNVPIAAGLLLTYQIVDAGKYTLAVQRSEHSLYRRAITALSEAVGSTTLDEVLHSRQALYAEIKSMLTTAVNGWGVDVQAVELRDVAITDEAIREAVSMKARAAKEAEAELVRAEMQGKIAAQLVAAAKLYDDDAWKLKGFETLTELCRSAENNTVIIPSDLVSVLARIGVGK